VPAGPYYLFAVASYNNQFLVWDLRVDLKPDANSVTLDLRNLAPLEAESAQAKPSGGGNPSATASKPCQVADEPRSIKTGVPANSTLSVIGAGYTYTYTKKNEYGRVLESFTERGNFSNTPLYLLDEDAETVLQKGGIGPGLLGSRFATLLFIENTTLIEPGKLNELAPGLGSMLSILGGEKGAAEMAELAKSAKADIECAMKAVRAHSVAQMTTDANARGTFSNVPAGTYYLYGSFYRTHKPVRTGGLVWDLKVEVKPGQNTTMPSVDNAAWKQP